MTPDHADRAQALAKEAARASGAYCAVLVAEVARLEGSPIIQLLQVTQALADIVDDDAVVFDDTLPHNRVFEFRRCSGPPSYFFTPGTSGGWALGAAFGAKFALPGAGRHRRDRPRLLHVRDTGCRAVVRRPLWCALPHRRLPELKLGDRHAANREDVSRRLRAKVRPGGRLLLFADGLRPGSPGLRCVWREREGPRAIASGTP